MLLLVTAGGFSSLVAQPQATEARTAEARTAEDVIARCVEALGGEAAWRAIETLELDGRHTSFNHTEPFLLRRKRPDRFRFDHNESTFKLTAAYDGESAWWRTDVPLFSKASWPVAMPRPYVAYIEAEAEFEWPFIGYREKGHEIELVGETEFDGEPFVELRITRRQSPEAAERWFLDRQSLLPVLRLSRGTYHGYYTEQLAHFTDYREVAGVLLPHRVETELGNDYTVLEVASVRVNADLDDEVFSRPLPAGMEKLRTLAGRWRVEIVSLDDPAVHTERLRTFEEDETVAIIRSRLDGSLLEEEILVATDRPRQVRRLWTYDRFRDVFRIAHFDTYSQHLDVLEGQMTDDGRLVLSNRDTGTPVLLFGQSFHVRENLHELHPDSFRLDREVSPDGGNTWLPDLRLTYTRLADDPPGRPDSASRARQPKR